MIKSNCRLCNHNELIPVISLPNAPIADKYGTYPLEKIDKYPLDIYQCANCGHVQITEVLPLELLFNSEYTYKPSKNKNLVSHFTTYAEMVASALGKPPKKSLDVGSNDGLFLSILKDRYSTDILGIDPAQNACNYANSLGVNTINDFFGIDTAEAIKNEYGTFDHISANNVYAHNDDLQSFTKAISNILESGGVFSFEISYLIDIVNKSLVGTIFHEHLSHHSLLPLFHFLEIYDLHLFDAIKVDTQGGALICFASKTIKREKTISLKSLVEIEESLNVTSHAYMNSFRQNIISLKSNFTRNLNNFKSKEYRFIGYGAARSANFLIEFLQLGNIIDIVIDDNYEKIGKFLPNSSIRIENAQEFIFEDGDVVIPLAWIHTLAIHRKLLSNRFKGKVLTIYPEVNMYSLGE